MQLWIIFQTFKKLFITIKVHFAHNESSIPYWVAVHEIDLKAIFIKLTSPASSDEGEYEHWIAVCNSFLINNFAHNK